MKLSDWNTHSVTSTKKTRKTLQKTVKSSRNSVVKLYQENGCLFTAVPAEGAGKRGRWHVYALIFGGQGCAGRIGCEIPLADTVRVVNNFLEHLSNASEKTILKEYINRLRSEENWSSEYLNLLEAEPSS